MNNVVSFCLKRLCYIKRNTLDNDNNISLKYNRARYLEIAPEVDLNFNLLSRVITVLECDKLYTKQDLDIKEFSKCVFTNKTYLSELINRLFNTNFNQFINFFRVKEACYELEKDEDVSVTLLCENIGYKSFSACSCAFKRYTGLTPSNWHKRVEALKYVDEDVDDAGAAGAGVGFGAGVAGAEADAGVGEGVGAGVAGAEGGADAGVGVGVDAGVGAGFGEDCVDDGMM